MIANTTGFPEQSVKRSIQQIIEIKLLVRKYPCNGFLLEPSEAIAPPAQFNCLVDFCSTMLILGWGRGIDSKESFGFDCL